MGKKILPKADGWYVDCGGFMWALDDGEWSMYLRADIQPRDLPSFADETAFGPFTRMLPMHQVDGMLGRDLMVATTAPWPEDDQ